MLYSAKETCNFKEPTVRSRPISAKADGALCRRAVFEVAVADYMVCLVCASDCNTLQHTATH